MKYILASIITIVLMYGMYKLTELACDLLDKVIDYLERKRNERY